MQQNLLHHFQQLRTELFKTELLLQQTPINNAKAWSETMNHLFGVLQRCAHLAAQTELRLYPLAEVYEPAVVDALRQQQRTINAHHFAAAIVSLPATGAPHELEAARQNIIAAFDNVVLCQMQFLLQLQNNLLPVLHRYYTAAHLQQLAVQFGSDTNTPAAADAQLLERMRAAEAAFRRNIAQTEASTAPARQTAGWPSLVMQD